MTKRQRVVSVSQPVRTSPVRSQSPVVLGATLIKSLLELPSPVLTAYLDTFGKQANPASTPACVTWLKSVARSAERDLQPAQRPAFREQLQRVQSFLATPVRQCGLVIFAGPGVWQLVPMELEIANELHWGKPSLLQLETIVGEHKPSCIVTVDRTGAKLFRYQFGEIRSLEMDPFQIDQGQWKRKDYGHTARAGTKLSHGPQHDIVKHHMDAEYLHLCRRVAEETNALCKKEGLVWIFLVGSARLTEPIRNGLPADVRPCVMLVQEDLAHFPSTALKRHLRPRVAEWMAKCADRRVRQLLDSDRGTVAGVDETLAQLQAGKISTMVLLRGMEATVRRCVKCGLTSRSADPVCSVCGGQRPRVALSEVLPGLARSHATGVEVINGDAGKRLGEAGGMGGWLRQLVR
jgi:Bacterial archaeo-eukaryotic release factor family 10